MHPPTTERPTVVRWRVVAWIVLASIVAFILRFNLSVAAPEIKRELGLSETQLGLVLGAFAWFYGLGQLPGGLIGDRFGPRRTMAVMFVAWFATTALVAAIPRGIPVVASVALLVMLRAVHGLAQAPVFPVTCGGTFFAWLPPGYWALANSLSSAGVTVGAALTGPAVTWLVLTVGWRQSFLIVAPLGLVLAAIWWHDYRDDPATHRGVNRLEAALIGEGRASITAEAPVTRPRTSFICSSTGFRTTSRKSATCRRRPADTFSLRSGWWAQWERSLAASSATGCLHATDHAPVAA